MIYFLFDFDKTLFNSLEPNEIKILSGLDIKGYDDPNSIPLNRNYISGKRINNIGESWNENIVNLAKRKIKNSKKFLVTGRPKNEIFMAAVIEFLKNNGLKFDGYYFGYDHFKFDRSKQFALEEIISKFGIPNKVYFFDDNDRFVNDFKNYYLFNKPKFKLIINKIINGELSEENFILENKKSYNKPKKSMKSRWSIKYKRKINCNNPKGFSQKQYCKRKKRRGKYLSEENKNMKITIFEIKNIIKEEIKYYKFGIKPKISLFESKNNLKSKLRKIIQEQLRVLSAEERYQFAKKSLSIEMHKIISDHLDKLNSETIAKAIIKNVDKEKIEKIKKVMFTSQIGDKDEYDEEKAADFSAYVHRMIGEYLTSLMKSADENDVFEPVSGKKPKVTPGDFPLGGSGVRDLSTGSGVSGGQGRGSGVSDSDMQTKGGSGVINKSGSGVQGSDNDSGSGVRNKSDPGGN